MSLPPEQVQAIPEALVYWANATPDAIAMLSPGREPATYREIAAAVDRIAMELRGRGFGRQDGIALLLPEGPELCLALLAAMSVGIAIPLAWPAPEAEYHRVLATPHVRAVVVSAEGGRLDLGPAGTELQVVALNVGRAFRIIEICIEGQSIRQPSPETRPGADDIALILHSSGTTDRPKLVPRTHRALVSTCRTVIEARGVTSADRCLSLARAGYSQGINALVVPLFAGASAIGNPGLEAGTLPQWLTTSRPTVLSTTPAVLRVLAENHGGLRDALQGSPLRYINSSAGAISTEELGDLEATLGVRLLNGYGLSEATNIAGERYRGYQRVPGAVGAPWCEVQIIAESGIAVGAGTTGEIVVRGPRVFPGYLDDPDATAAAFLPNGWFRTGDVGLLDDGGYLHLTGRLSEIINRGGEKIAPVEIDRVLLRHPAVAAAAAFGVPDARLGEDVVTAVVLKQGRRTMPRELRGWMLDRLAPYKVPRRIWLVDNLPRTVTGKVQRGELARRWSEEQG